MSSTSSSLFLFLFNAANAAVGGEFLARALGTVLAARIAGPLVVSSDAGGSSGGVGGGEERLWVRKTKVNDCFFDVSLAFARPSRSVSLSHPLSPSLSLPLTCQSTVQP